MNNNAIIKKLQLSFIAAVSLISILFLAAITGIQFFSGKASVENEVSEALEMTVYSYSRLANNSFPDEPGPNPFDNSNRPPFANITPDDSFIYTDPRGARDADFYGMTPSETDSKRSSIRNELQAVPTICLIISPERDVSLEKNDIYYIDDDTAVSIGKTIFELSYEKGSVEGYDLNYKKVKYESGRTVVAIADKSTSMSMVYSQLKTNLWISLGVFVLLFIGSVFMSKLVTRPIEKAWADQKRFVADASHELKTPLTVIISNTEMLLSKERDDEKEKMRLENIKEESTKMKDLVQQLVEVAKGDSEGFKTDFADFDFSSLLTECVLMMEPVAYESKKTFETKIEDNIILRGDRDRIRQLINILLDNAIKYGAPESNIDVSLKKAAKSEKNIKKGSIIFSVAGKGTPLSNEECEKIFERFYRVDSSREETSGYGLGLPIATAICKAHGAVISASSNGKDTNTFTVIFDK